MLNKNQKIVNVNVIDKNQNNRIFSAKTDQIRTEIKELLENYKELLSSNSLINDLLKVSSLEYMLRIIGYPTNVMITEFKNLIKEIFNNHEYYHLFTTTRKTLDFKDNKINIECNRLLKTTLAINLNKINLKLESLII